MTTMAMNNLWNYIAGLNLSSRNQAWLGERLIEAAKRTREQEELKPYTREELDARIDKAESQSAAGMYREGEDLYREMEQKYGLETVAEVV